VARTQSGLSGRNFANGRKMYAATRCIVCHRFDGEGGATGPDLTNVAGRFSFRDLCESIVEPSKVVSDQYRASTIVTAQGKIYTGRVVGDSKETLSVLIDPEDITKVVEINKSDVDDVAPSQLSLMPKDLLKSLNEDELLDLLAYLMSRGNPNDLMFTK
jgi:putative heme-binding domain-containing protein